MKSIRNLWSSLNRTIYTGQRLQANLAALTYASIVTALLGLILIVINIVERDNVMLTAASITFLAGVGCGIFAGIFKKREIAVLFPTAFCAIVFTMYAATALGEGTAILWSMLLPIGMCYFVSVKYGILLSAYYTVLFFVICYTPLGAHLREYYSEAFMLRFALLYAMLALFTSYAMAQYHRAVLTEIEYTDRLSREVERQTQVARERADSLAELSEEMVQTLAVAIDAKDKYTNGHSFRVSWYSVALAEKLGWSEEEQFTLRREALLHDIGKIGVPDLVLNKPGRLTDDEYITIKSHTYIGGDILGKSESLIGASEVARYHHERYDGSGYPEGLSGERIPLHARLVAIADSYDAMRSDRVYRKGLSKDIIARELEKGRGTQFDPELLDPFIALFKSGKLDEALQKYAA